MPRIAHYVRSSHWDREWYESFQGYRMRLVSVLDEVLEHLQNDEHFRYQMDGQTIPVNDYLEIRPEHRDQLLHFIQNGRFKAGPWYVAPDEMVVSGESLIRNLEMGIEKATAMGQSSRVGFVCDQFGHTGQLPQIFAGFGIGGAFLWRGVKGKVGDANFIWESPDGTSIPAYWFPPRGYGTLAYEVRDVFEYTKPLIEGDTIDRLVKFTLEEATRSTLSDILLFDGADHLEIEPKMSAIIEQANARLVEHDIQIIASDMDAYQAAMIHEREKITHKLTGELRETGGRPGISEDQWAIGGYYASRITLKQRNAECEDELCLWAEPFSTFAHEATGDQYPHGFLRVAWQHLIENHPHDSICGCSIDSVHKDMVYRFDQSHEISSRLTRLALRSITAAAAPEVSENQLCIGIFNATAETIDETIDLQIPIPSTWKTKFAEFFGYNERPTFLLRDPDANEISYQLIAQQRDVTHYRHARYKFPILGKHHAIDITAKLKVPAFGYTTIIVEEAPLPNRYSGSQLTSHRSMENQFLAVAVNSNGTLLIHDKRSGKIFDQCLTFEERADIGDGWWHGPAINDLICTSTAATVDVAVVTDGRFKSTLRIDVTMQVPIEFDYRLMRRSERRAPLRIISDVTLRADSDRIEILTTVHNNITDHRLRVLHPTNLPGDTYQSDQAFDVIDRTIAPPADNDSRREPVIETQPQQSWTAFGDGKAGLAIVSRGLPECGVLNRTDRPIALTLLRGFRKAVFSGDNIGGQVLGTHRFRFDLVPFEGTAPLKRLFLLGQRIAGTVRQSLLPPVGELPTPAHKLPRSDSFFKHETDAIVTSIRNKNNRRQVRLFNPSASAIPFAIEADATACRLDGRQDTASGMNSLRGKALMTVQW